MIITAKADGTLIKTVPERIYQGSNNADTIVVVAPIIQTATMNIRFKLPQINEYTQNFLMTPASTSIYADLGVSVWTYSINSTLTQYYGTVQSQFSAMVNGAVVSSGAFTFEVERGVEVDLPDPENPNHTYDDIYDYLTNMSTRIFVNGELEAKAILPYDDLFAYSNGAVIFDGGDFYKSLVNNNLGNALSDTTKWQKIDFYSASEVDALLATFAGKKYPVGSTTGTGEVFNDYTNNVASGDYSHAEGWHTTASQGYSHAEGESTLASGYDSHAEGSYSEASGWDSHAEGNGTKASGFHSHAEGSSTTASGIDSHAGGVNSNALHSWSFVHGDYVSSSANNQTVFGVANEGDSDALLIVGNGEVVHPGVSSIISKSNAFVVKKNGDIYGGNNKQLATKDYVDTQDATKQDKIDSSHKLSADLVDDTSTTNKFVTASEKTQITTNANDIASIEDLIPAQASSSNQLADKNFVNSSIGTNTANFIGTFENVSDLESYSGTITNNDYAFVINQELDFATTTAMNAYDKTLLTNYDYAWVENGAKYDLYRFDIIEQTWGVRATNISKGDVSLIVAYNRYKYNETTSEWGWEYTLNTSGFTANQWAAINSGITDTDVTQIGTNTSNIFYLQTDKVDKSKNGGLIDDGVSYNLESNINNSGTNIEFKISNHLDSSIVYTDVVVDKDGMTVNGNYIETQNNKVVSLSNASTDTQYPSAKCVYDAIINNKGIIELVGTQAEPINMATDMEVGKLYLCSGYVRMNSSDVYTLETDCKIMAFKPSATEVDWINAVVTGTGVPTITSNIGGNATITINSTTGGVVSTTYTKSIASFNGVLGQTNAVNLYAPTSSGTSGYLLQSNGSGTAPTFNIEKVTSISSGSTDSQIPSAKCVYDLIGDVETLLASI